MPNVENDMLVFDDHDHFDSYLSYLDAIVMDEPLSEQETDTDSTEIHEKLLSIEQSINFFLFKS